MKASLEPNIWNLDLKKVKSWSLLHKKKQLIKKTLLTAILSD